MCRSVNQSINDDLINLIQKENTSFSISLERITVAEHYSHAYVNKWLKSKASDGELYQMRPKRRPRQSQSGSHFLV